MVKRILRKYKYLPDQQDAAVELVLQPAKAPGVDARALNPGRASRSRHAGSPSIARPTDSATSIPSTPADMIPPA